MNQNKPELIDQKSSGMKQRQVATDKMGRRGEAVDVSILGSVEPKPGGLSPPIPPPVPLKVGAVGGVKVVTGELEGVLVFGVLVEPPAVLQSRNP